MRRLPCAPIFSEPGWNLHKPEKIGIVADHYNTFMKLGLTSAETRDLIEYLKSL
jgi:hypothetical protein